MGVYVYWEITVKKQRIWKQSLLSQHFKAVAEEKNVWPGNWIDRLWYSQSVMNYSLDELFGLILFWYREVSIICWKKKLQKLIFIKLHPDFYKKRTKKFLKMLMVFKLTVWTGFDLEPVIWDIMSLFLFLWCPRTIRPYNSKSL